MRRVQIHLDEALDDAAGEEAARRGISTAALIRESLARALGESEAHSPNPWLAITGWLDGSFWFLGSKNAAIARMIRPARS